MSRRLAVTVSAFHDLDTAYDYIADSTSEAKADAFFAAINEAMHGLLTFPFRGPAYHDAALPEHANVRRVLVWTHQIVYEIGDTSITIIAVIDQRRDARVLLQERTHRR